MTDSAQNFARYTRSYWDSHPEEQESIIQEHVARIQQGVDVWNTFDQAFAAYLEANDIEDGVYDFRGAELSNVQFRIAQFSVDAYFDGAIFSGEADFSGATFKDKAKANFISAKFKDKANFLSVTFNGTADFTKAKFKHVANFFDATFEKVVIFSGATFGARALFIKATFNGIADFDAFTEFCGETNFESTTFESICSFNRATSTECIPSFLGTQYKTAPLIEGFKIPWVKGQPKDNIEKYRQLKKIAIDGANHEQELRFFGFETHCKIYLEYPALTRFSIWLYWVFSNFGQSLLRPLGALVLVWIVAAAITISTTMKSPIPETLVSLIMFEDLGPCEAIPSNAFRSKLDAIRSQSIGSSLTLPVIAMDKDTQHQRNQCLYGQGGGVPETNRIINGIQQVLSLIFLFLCGLVVRNRFKIK
jgi:uncharacterized protein YjbI with pentapeptide repeats